MLMFGVGLTLGKGPRQRKLAGFSLPILPYALPLIKTPRAANMMNYIYK